MAIVLNIIVYFSFLMVISPHHSISMEASIHKKLPTPEEIDRTYENVMDQYENFKMAYIKAQRKKETIPQKNLQKLLEKLYFFKNQIQRVLKYKPEERKQGQEFLNKVNETIQILEKYEAHPHHIKPELRSPSFLSRFLTLNWERTKNAARRIFKGSFNITKTTDKHIAEEKMITLISKHINKLSVAEPHLKNICHYQPEAYKDVLNNLMTFSIRRHFTGNKILPAPQIQELLTLCPEVLKPGELDTKEDARKFLEMKVLKVLLQAAKDTALKKYQHSFFKGMKRKISSFTDKNILWLNFTLRAHAKKFKSKLEEYQKNDNKDATKPEEIKKKKWEPNIEQSYNTLVEYAHIMGFLEALKALRVNKNGWVTKAQDDIKKHKKKLLDDITESLIKKTK